MEVIDLEGISPGVRDLVKDLTERGFVTTDSGDGTNHAEGMECALPFRHVYGIIPDGESLIDFAVRLNTLYPEARVEVSYSPGEAAIFMLFPDGYPEEPW